MWLLVQFLVPISQPLAGAPLEAACMRVLDKEHYTNIYRVAWLARQHPLVDAVDILKVKGHKSACDTTGRAMRHHQSPWNLRLTIGASGAVSTLMMVGLSVRNLNSSVCGGVICAR